jgi:ribulose-5-phosphate 4-epimerase/fuculose-1-phosphate aldolase
LPQIGFSFPKSPLIYVNTQGKFSSTSGLTTTWQTGDTSDNYEKGLLFYLCPTDFLLFSLWRFILACFLIIIRTSTNINTSHDQESSMTSPTIAATAINNTQADIDSLRVDLSAAYRMATRLDMHEGICNHLSVMLPGGRDRFLINRRDRHWGRITASNLLVIDADGNTIEGDGQPLRTGPTIHTRIHLEHPDAQVVFHTHMPYATAIACTKGGRLLPVHQNSLRFIDRCAYDETFSGLALDMDEGSRMAQVMGDKRILFLRHHGVIVVADSIAQAFDDLYYLERACKFQVLAATLGEPAVMPEDVARAGAAQFAGLKDSAQRHFSEVKAILDDKEPDYAD